MLIDRERGTRPAGGQLDLAVGGEDRAGLEHVGRRAGLRPDRLVHGDQLGAVRKHAFDLQDRHHRGDAGHHVVGGQDRRSERHQIGDAASLARAFEDFVGDDRDRFRMVELQSLGAALSRQLGGGKDRQAFQFGRREQHARSP